LNGIVHRPSSIVVTNPESAGVPPTRALVCRAEWDYDEDITG
jgi:hypothetical protein